MIKTDKINKDEIFSFIKIHSKIDVKKMAINPVKATNVAEYFFNADNN